MSHRMRTDFESLGGQRSQVFGPKRTFSILTKDGNIVTRAQSGPAQHLRDPQILWVAVVPTGRYNSSIHHGKARRAFPCVVSQLPSAVIFEATGSGGASKFIPNATPIRKKKGTAEWENSKYGCTTLWSNKNSKSKKPQG